MKAKTTHTISAVRYVTNLSLKRIFAELYFSGPFFTWEKEQFRFESINTGPGTAILATLLYEVVPFSVEVGKKSTLNRKKIRTKGENYTLIVNLFLPITK